MIRWPRSKPRRTLIASYEGDHVLYDRYIEWWLQQRAAIPGGAFNSDSPASCGGEPQVLFTPWISEQVPELVPRDSVYNGVGVVTDDPAWWDALCQDADRMAGIAGSRCRWRSTTWWPRAGGRGRWPSAGPSTIPATGAMRRCITARPAPIRSVTANVPGVMLTYPSDAGSPWRDRNRSVHFGAQARPDRGPTLRAERKRPGLGTHGRQHRLGATFQNTVGYDAVDVDRAGPLACLNEARAVALATRATSRSCCASSFSTGFPLELRRVLPGLPGRARVAVQNRRRRRLRSRNSRAGNSHRTPRHLLSRRQSDLGREGRGATPAACAGGGDELVTRQNLGNKPFTIRLEPAALRAFRVNDAPARARPGWRRVSRVKWLSAGPSNLHLTI